MTDHIEFKENEAEFRFRLEGVSYVVRTEVGEGPARVVVDQVGEPEEQPLEQSE